MKKILLLCLLFIISCRTVQDRFLYDENDDGYNILVRQAAAECIANNDIFDNLKATSFEDYSILNAGNYIKVTSNVFIWINLRSADSVTFTVITDGTYDNNTYANFLENGKKYSISRSDNNAIVDSLAIGVCNGGDYEGTPSASSSTLTFSVKNYYVEDGSDLSVTTTEPDEYQGREDSFSMSKSYPAFLFLWSGTYQTNTKNDGESEETTNTFSAELTIEDSDVSGCLEGIENGDTADCTKVIADDDDLQIINQIYDQTRDDDSDKHNLQTYYFTEFVSS